MLEQIRGAKWHTFCLYEHSSTHKAIIQISRNFQLFKCKQRVVCYSDSLNDKFWQRNTLVMNLVVPFMMLCLHPPSNISPLPLTYLFQHLLYEGSYLFAWLDDPCQIGIEFTHVRTVNKLNLPWDLVIEERWEVPQTHLPLWQDQRNVSELKLSLATTSNQ